MTIAIFFKSNFFNQGTANNDTSVWHYYQGKDINIFESFLQNKLIVVKV